MSEIEPDDYYIYSYCCRVILTIFTSYTVEVILKFLRFSKVCVI